MQEEITQRTVSLSVEAGKMTADLLQKAVKKVLEEMQKKPSQRTLHQGKQTLHQLKQHGASLTNIEITEQNIKAFSAVAKKYDIDYALKKDPTTDPPHYYVFFKAKDKDQLQPAFKEFTAMTLNRELTAFLKAYASGLITLPEGMMEAEAAADPGDEDMEDNEYEE